VHSIDGGPALTGCLSRHVAWGVPLNLLTKNGALPERMMLLCWQPRGQPARLDAFESTGADVWYEDWCERAVPAADREP